MSSFSDVDRSMSGARLIDSLEESARGLAAMKQYMAVAHSLREPSAPVLDIGSGAGHDLAALEAVGVPAIGIDPSSTMLGAARARVSAPLLRASGEQLPFRNGAFAGCWIERVLMHVVSPWLVVSEAMRCLRPGGLLTVFEPDWTSLAVNGTKVPGQWLRVARHPSIGLEVGDLVREHGGSVLDRVEEHSWWDFDTFARVTNLAALPSRLPHAAAWAMELRASAETGEFSAEFTKILWVAVAPR